MRPHLIAIATSLALLFAVAAFAAEAPSTVVVIPWGDWIVAAAKITAEILLPALLGAAVAAIFRLAPWLQLFLSTALVERLVKNAADYALNSVAGATKGQVLSVDTGSVVIQKAVQRAVDQAPSWLLAKAGGPEGIAEKVYRLLRLAPQATEGNTLAPAVAAIPPK